VLSTLPPDHFASTETEIYIISSTDWGQTWDFEHRLYMGSDMREPFFIEFNGILIFSFFQAGTDPLEFSPKYLFRITRQGFQQWSEPDQWGQPGEIAWQLKYTNTTAYATSYIGDHYGVDSNLQVYFNYTTDGFNWKPFNVTNPTMYYGGVSEVGWEFDIDGNFWGVLRNEDGDNSGWGSHVAFAPQSDLGNWQLFPQQSDPWIYESPRMFRHGNDLFLIARRDINGPYDLGYTWLPFDVQKYIYLGEYSLRAHTTSLFQLDMETKSVVWLMDMPGDGDTAFPSIIRIGPHKYLVANYSSPLNHPDWSWIEGQTSSEGTQIYFIEIEFIPESSESINQM